MDLTTCFYSLNAVKLKPALPEDAVMSPKTKRRAPRSCNAHDHIHVARHDSFYLSDLHER